MPFRTMVLPGFALALMIYAFSPSGNAEQGTPAPRPITVDDVFEIREHQLAGFLKDISAEFRDLRFDDPGQERPQLGEARLFVTGDQPAVAGHHDRRKSARNALCRFVEHDSPAPLSKTRPKILRLLTSIVRTSSHLRDFLGS